MTCSICLIDITSREKKLQCGHSFHESCITTLYFLYLSNKCPICRAEYTYILPKFNKQKKRLKKYILKIYSEKYKNEIFCKEIINTAHFIHPIKISKINKLENTIYRTSSRLCVHLNHIYENGFIDCQESRLIFPSPCCGCLIIVEC